MVGGDRAGLPVADERCRRPAIHPAPRLSRRDPLQRRVAVAGTCGISQALDLGQSQQLTNARIAWTSPLGHWTWALYGRNLLDNQYINSLGTYGKTVLGTVGARVSEPRTYGVEVGVKF